MIAAASATKSTKTWHAERWLIHGVLVFVLVTTGLLWTHYLTDGRVFGSFSHQVKAWYGFYIGALFSGVAGVGFYPLLGSRVWCRFGCPMAAILGILQRTFSRFRITTSGTEADLLDVVALLLEDARHVLVFCRSEDRAADMGDLLTLHGYMAGAPGDGDMPVWLGVDELAARAAAKDHEGVVVVSCDVPADQDSLDRRHGISDDGVVLVLPREVAHLRSVARETGYTVKPLPPQSRAAEGSLDRLRATLEDAMRDEDIAPYLLALEPLFSQHDPAEVAAAAVALLRKKVPSAPPVTVPAADASPSVPDATAWAKIFLSVGERDNLRPGDLLGAITGEAGIKGEQVGRIDIHESHTVVEVNHSAARQVIKALNGTTIRGRSVRADFDRPKRPSPGRGRRP